MSVRSVFHRTLITIGGVYVRLFPPSPVQAIRRVVLIRPDDLGDVLWVSPALARLREALPDVAVTLEVQPSSCPIAFAGSEGVAVEAVSFPGFVRGPKPHPMRPYVDLWFESQHLAHGHYDAALILRPDHWWGGATAAVGRIPYIVGYDTRDVRPALAEIVPEQPYAHSVRTNLLLVERLIAKATGQPLRALPADDAVLMRQHPLIFHVSEAARREAGALLADLGRNAPLIVVSPGAGVAVKQWVPERWAQVADALAEAHGATIVLTGTRGEASLTAVVAAAMRYPALDLAGKTTIPVAAAVFERAALVLGPDSGALHIAVAVGTPTVHLYGPADPRKFGPWGDPARHIVLTADVRDIPCLACGDLSPDRPAAPPCLTALQVVDVLTAAERVLRAEQEAPRLPIMNNALM